MALEQFFYNNPNPCWVYECKSLHFIEVNKSCLSVYGYSEDDFLQSLNIHDLQPPDDALLLKEYIKEDPVFGDSGIWRHITKTGEIFHVHIFSQATQLNGQKCMYVMATDVEKQVQFERKFRERYCASDKLQNSILGIKGEPLKVRDASPSEQRGYPPKVLKTVTLYFPPHVQR